MAGPIIIFDLCTRERSRDANMTSMLLCKLSARRARAVCGDDVIICDVGNLFTQYGSTVYIGMAMGGSAL